VDFAGPSISQCPPCQEGTMARSRKGVRAVVGSSALILAVVLTGVAAARAAAPPAAAPAGAPSGAAQEQAPRRIVLKAARLVDRRNARVGKQAVVVIEGNRITEAGPGLKPPSGAVVIDLGEATLLPGLIDCHDHLTSNPEQSGYRSLGV